MTSGGAALLDALRDAHGEVLARLDALAALTDREQPDRAELSAIRYHLSRASGARRRLIEDRIYPLLFSRTAGDVAESVRKLQDEGAAILAHSSLHIHRWTIDKAVAHWPSYCAASVEMRASMRARIHDEQRILYPLLRMYR